MKLIDGKGQLGERLKNTVDLDVIVYHTWNFLDKSEKTQLKEYMKFLKFISRAPKNVLFISTLSNSNNPYVRYKRQAEEDVLLMPDSTVIRFPNLIGKGICQRLRDDEAKPYGKIELMTLDDAASKIIDVATEKKRERIYDFHGEEVSAELVYNLIRFGKGNNA